MRNLPFTVAAFFSVACAVSMSLHAGEHPQSVAGQTAEVAWYDCQFGPVPGREAVQLMLMTRGDAVVRVVVTPYGICGIDHSQLQVGKSGEVEGKLIIGHEPRRMNRSLVPKITTRMPLQLALKISEGQVSGTFDGQWPHEKSIERAVDVAGKVTGVLRTEKDLNRDNAIDASANWTSWLGPKGNFATPHRQPPLVDDLNDAQLVWASQWIGPTESGSQRYGACVGSPPCAGGASPLFAHGRIYQFRYQASGEAMQQTHLDKVLAGEKGDETRTKLQAIGWTEKDLRERWAIRADEQLVCIDAATGKTLWTVTWLGEGINLYDHKCSLTNHTGVIADGNVYVFGGLGIIRCVDAKTGDVRWSAEIPGYHDTMQTFLSKCLETKNVWASSRSFCHGLNIAGDTLLAPDGIGECGIVGFDAKTGEVRWHVQDRILGKCATPMPWTERGTGRQYVLAGNSSGQITLVSADDGAVAWQYNDAGDNEFQILLSGDHLVAHKLTKEQREKAPVPQDDGPHSAPGENVGQVACWKVTTEGLKEVWAAPAEWGAPKHCPIGTACVRDGDQTVICFRGGFSYHVVDLKTGKKLASHHLPTPVRWDEGHMLSASNTFVLHPDSQHGVTKMFTLPVGGKVSPIWMPPHPHATTYQSAMSHAWADGRLFIRGADALYCYDLRKNKN